MSDWYWLNNLSIDFLNSGYLKGITAKGRIKQIGDTAQAISGIEGFSDKFVSYMAKGWISLASPVWSNFGNDRGLPISCNGSKIEDSVEDILFKTAEIGMMTKMGSGTSAYLGAIRPFKSPISVGGTADGPVRFAELLETTTGIVSQGNVRRGHCAVFLDVEHPDVSRFLKIRSTGHPIQNLSFGVCVGDDWIRSMIAGDKEKRVIWTAILKKRFETGFPYIFFTDTVNNNKPDTIKERIYATNMCTEIALPADKDNSFVCCLSSLNLLHWDDWKDTDLVETMTIFLDCVIEEYINKTKDILLLKNAHNFAKKYRAIGLGTLGWHSYLQSKMIPFESIEAQSINSEIYQVMRSKAEAQSKGKNATLLAIAPTTSSSFILGQVSPSIEPLNSNYFIKNLAKGKFTYKNPYLINLLEDYNRSSDEVWETILIRGGSVQHLDFLSEHEKNVFKTFGEISQAEIIQQAADRQKYIDQAQSLNTMIHPDTPLKDVNELVLTAWRLGVKTLYYQRSTNPAQELARNLLDCSSCEA